MRSLLLTGLSLVLTAAVIGNAYYQKQQFYPSVVYITKSNPSMAVMYVQALVFVVLVGKMLRAIFFGQLRAAEMEHLIERSWYAVTETCLAFTVFRDDFSPRFVALFTLLLFLKCFHWLAEDRIDYMERSPAISWLFHIRALCSQISPACSVHQDMSWEVKAAGMVLTTSPISQYTSALMFVLGLLDILFVRHAFESTMTKGPSVQLVFGFEYEILFTVVLMTFIKYVLHTIDLRSQNPWDNKAVYLLYSELVMGLIRVVLYVAFVFIMIKVHTFPLFAIRPMYLTVRAFQKTAQDVVLSRRAIRNMNTLYPDATPEELSAGDNVCIICREEMTTGCKKLPCNHIFHTSCLRSWFQRQQSCPTCRLEVLRMPRPAAAAAAAAPTPQPQPQQAPPDQVPNPLQNMQGMFGGFPFQWPPNVGGQAAPNFMWQPPQQQQEQPAAAATTAAATTTTQAQNQPVSTAAGSSGGSTVTAAAAPPFTNPFMSPVPPMMPFMPPMFVPFGFPPPPIPTTGLNEDELRVMEGIERSNIEARIQWLRDIQALLDGAMVLINQYNNVASHIGVTSVNTARVQPPCPAPTSQASSEPTSSNTTQQTSATWWPEGSGARPKYTSTVSKPETTNSVKERRSSSNTSDVEEEKPLEGATGITLPQEEPIPEWENSREGKNGDEMHEVRKRRLQHFSQQNNNGTTQASVSLPNGDNDSSNVDNRVSDKKDKC